MSNLHWFNIPGYPQKEETTHNVFVNALREITRLSDDIPLYISMLDSKIEEFLDMVHTPDESELLNKRGLHIYLYEPMSSYLTSFARYGVSIFPTEFDLSLLRSEELESIKLYAERNSLTNITVHTCDYDVDKYYYPYYSKMILVCDDITLQSYTTTNDDYKMSYDFTRKFLNINWRYTKARNLIALYLCTLPAHLSWAYNVERGAVARESWFDMDIWKENYPEVYKNIINNEIVLSEMAPISVDVKYNSALPVTGSYATDPHFPDSDASNLSIFNEQDRSLERFYRDSFVNIITESRFAQPTGNYSEKTYQAILYHKPFIIVAPPKTLQYVREEGFKTFGDFWDESYDQCMNHEDRMIKIYRVIDHINSKSFVDLQQMYLNMKDIMEYNYQVLLSKSPLRRSNEK